MAAIANVILGDGVGNRTFNPAKTQADMAVLENRANGIYIGYDKLTFMLARPTGPVKAGQNRNLKLTVKIESPIMETLSNDTSSGIAPAPTVAYRPTVEVTFTLPERTSLAQRNQLRVMLANLCVHATFAAAVDNYDLPY